MLLAGLYVFILELSEDCEILIQIQIVDRSFGRIDELHVNLLEAVDDSRVFA